MGERTVAEWIGATSRAEAVSAAKTAGAHAFIAELSEGYDTPLPEESLSRSARGGRLAMARLLASGAPEGNPPPAPAPPDAGPLPVDPALPRLPWLLNADLMAPVLGRSIGADTDPAVRLRSVRYKPGDSVVVHYDVDAPGGWTEVVAYATRRGRRVRRKLRRPEAMALAARIGDRAPTTRPLSFDPEVRALIQWLPLDLRLPILAERGAELARRLASVGLAVEAGEEPVLLRYWARRRAVLRIGDHVVKAYRDGADFAAAEAGLRAAGALTRVRTPFLEGLLPGTRATVQPFFEGSSPSISPRASEPAGALLADLHGEAPAYVEVADSARLLAKAANRAAFVAQLLPGLEGRIRSLLEALEERRPRGLPLRVGHGNFHAGQLLATAGGLALIDLDRLCLAPPAYDIASFATHLAFGRRPGDQEAMDDTVESLLRGYGTRPAGLSWFLSTCLLRRAIVPFRHLDERWPQATEALVASAWEVLHG